MTKKTKPVYLLIAGILLLAVAIIFVFLLTQAYNTNVNNYTSTVDEISIRYPNAQNLESTKDNASPTEKASDDSLTTETVIRAKGLCIDKSGNVYDSKNNKYTVTDGHIAIVYEGNVYKVSIKEIKKVNPKIKKETSETTKKESENNSEDNQQNTIHRNENNTNNNSQTNATPITNSQQQVIGSVSVNQSQNVTTSQNKSPTENNVKMSYKSFTIEKGAIFNLELINAGNSVLWNTDREFLELVQPIGNRCSFKSIKVGTTKITAKYLGDIYHCTITII